MSKESAKELEMKFYLVSSLIKLLCNIKIQDFYKRRPQNDRVQTRVVIFSMYMYICISMGKGLKQNLLFKVRNTRSCFYGYVLQTGCILVEIALLFFGNYPSFSFFNKIHLIRDVLLFDCYEIFNLPVKLYYIVLYLH